MKTFRKVVALSVMVLLSITPALAASTHTWKTVVASSSSTAAAYAIDENGALWSWSTFPASDPEPVLVDASGNWSSITTAPEALADRVVGVRDGQIFEAVNSDAVSALSGGTSWAAISSGQTAGGSYYIAQKDDGTLWSWGSNDLGQLGSAGGSVGAPTQILASGGHAGHSWTSVSTAGEVGSVAAIRDDGTLWVWGNNTSGELAGGAAATVEPTQIVGNWKSVVVNRTTNGLHSSILALDENGALYAWGMNEDGRLGTGVDGGIITAPVLVDAGPWAKIDSGSGMNVSYGIKEDGTLWSWGVTYDGMAGQGDGMSKILVPTQIVGFNDWQDITVGHARIFAQREGSNAVYGWGAGLVQIIDPSNLDANLTPDEILAWSWAAPSLPTVASTFPDGSPLSMQPNHFYLQLNN